MPLVLLWSPCLISTHHEMAHIQYYQQYSDQPQLFRDGDNPGDTPTNRSCSGTEQTLVSTINGRLLHHATGSFMVTLPDIDAPRDGTHPILPPWRWSVFEDGVHSMNSRWWQMKLRFQGVIRPVSRSEADFDPGSKYHIVSDQPGSSKSASDIIRTMSKGKTNRVSPESLVNTVHCPLLDVASPYNEIMQSGSSKSASDIIRTMSKGKTNRISPESLVKYFRPLELWLRVQNRDEHLIGWSSNYHDVALFTSRGESHRLRTSFTIVLSSLI
ncbi:Angiotensin-converting enzyme 8, partial [Operophtera brumata]